MRHSPDPKASHPHVPEFARKAFARESEPSLRIDVGRSFVLNQDLVHLAFRHDSQVIQPDAGACSSKGHRVGFIIP